MLNWFKSLAFKQKHREKRITRNAAIVDDKNALDNTHPRHRQGSQKNRDSHRERLSPKEKARHLASAVIVPRGEHGVSRKQIDTHALKVLYRLHNAGYQACLVGGAVRDLLLGKTPKDFDVATDATPEEVAALFRNCRLIGRRFRLAHVHFGRQIIEVATYRADHGHSQSGSLDESGRIVRDNVYGNICEDVMRRDFTANALYYDIANFSIIDFVGGLDDVRAGRLSMIGDAETRYREDPVRMLRAVRFAAKLDFTIEDHSRQPIYELGPLLADIPPARLYEEALKMFHSGHALKSFEALVEYDLLRYLFPAADAAIKEDAQFLQLLKLAMANTDERIRKDLRVTPAFLFAALLWAPVAKRADEITHKGMPYSVAIQKAATAVMSEQVKSISIPRRFTSTMRDIWGLQTRFHYRKGRRAQAVLEHPKFRAAYDFLCLRAQAGEDMAEACEWWTDFQQLPENQGRAGSGQDEAGERSRQRGKSGGRENDGEDEQAAPRKKRRRPRRRRSKKATKE